LGKKGDLERKAASHIMDPFGSTYRLMSNGGNTQSKADGNGTDLHIVWRNFGVDSSGDLMIYFALDLVSPCPKLRIMSKVSSDEGVNFGKVKIIFELEDYPCASRYRPMLEPIEIPELIPDLPFEIPFDDDINPWPPCDENIFIDFLAVQELALEDPVFDPIFPEGVDIPRLKSFPGIACPVIDG
jgi:hypothetical protein